MKVTDYLKIYDELFDYEKIPAVARKYGISEELALIIYSHRTVRNATRNFYRVKARADVLVKRWNKGESLLSIAKQHDFPPVLMAQVLLKAAGYGKKELWKMIKEPEAIKNPRLKREIKEVLANDYSYSPEALEIQRRRGEWGETQLAEWLREHGIEFERENDIRGKYGKTPDFLLKKPIKMNGYSIKWIESKANFGDKVELRKNMSRQLKPYVELFGPGVVLYWFGHIEPAPKEEKIAVVDASFLEKYKPRVE